jgi:tRNA(Ile)-lysidine synthase
MEISLPDNQTFIAAISGGVDSMVLLNLLVKNKDKHGWKIVVAHIDHGIRQDSILDKQLVEATAKQASLMFESVSLGLGEGASEDLARGKRYGFLEELKEKHSASSVITAHHEDDLLETAILNLIRGTGRKGLTSLISNPDRLRPLIKYSKPEIVEFATVQDIKWREDSTNSDTNYLRNYIRLEVMPRFSPSARLKLLSVINSMREINEELDKGLEHLVGMQPEPNTINRNWFNMLSHSLAKEVMATWLRQNGLGGFNSNTLERMVVSAKVARVGQRFPVLSGRFLIINKYALSLS